MTSSWMIVAGFLFAAMAVFVKLGAAYFDAAELAFYRSLVTFLMALGVVKAAGGTVRSKHTKWHVSRGIAGGISPRQSVRVSVVRPDGSQTQFAMTVRIDAPAEVEYFLHGGILPMVLRELRPA